MHRLQTGIFGNLFWVTLAGGLSWLLSSATMIYAARMIGTEAFGMLTFGLSITSYATILVNNGLLIWGVRAIARERARAGSIVVIINGLQLLLASFAYTLQLLIAYTFFAPPERTLIALCGLLLFALAFSMQWVCMGLEQFKLLGINQGSVNLVALLVTVAFVRTPADVGLVPLIMAGSQIGAAVLLFLWLYRRGLLRFDTLHLGQTWTIMRESFPLGISGAMLVAMRHTNNIALQLFHGAAMLGIFSAAYRLIEILSTIVSVFSNVFLPRMTAAAQENIHRATMYMRWYVRLLMSVAFFIGTLFLVEAPHIITTLYGEHFAASITSMRMMGLVVIFNFAATVYTTGLLALGYDRTYFWSICTALVLALGGSLLFIPTHGLHGAGTLVASLDMTIWLLTLPTYRRNIATLFLAEWVRPALGGLVLSGMLVLMSNFITGLWLRIAVGGAIYLLVVVPWGEVWARMRDEG